MNGYTFGETTKEEFTNEIMQKVSDALNKSKPRFERNFQPKVFQTPIFTRRNPLEVERRLGMNTGYRY